jgi:hypothetical protein
VGKKERRVFGIWNLEKEGNQSANKTREGERRGMS